MEYIFFSVIEAHIIVVEQIVRGNQLVFQANLFPVLYILNAFNDAP